MNYDLVILQLFVDMKSKWFFNYLVFKNFKLPYVIYYYKHLNNLDTKKLKIVEKITGAAFTLSI